MKIQINVVEAGWLHQAALLSQVGQSFAEAKEARELGKRLAAFLPQGEPVRIAVDGPREITVEMSAEELQMLHWQLANGTRWPFAEWGDMIMTAFGNLITSMAEWIKDVQAKAAFDALPEGEKQKALAQAKKEEIEMAVLAYEGMDTLPVRESPE